jgi:bidirectional [NiFe] hydrogenase diaphorase subunit
MSEITLNGRKVKVRKGEYLLAIARREGVDIPALCQLDSVEPSGACRLCMVEVTKAEWDGWSKLVTSCLFPAEEGLIVSTDSPQVRKTRKGVLELLMARSPNAKPVQELARQYGIEQCPYPVDYEGDNCILCDICTRVCQDLVTGAIARIDRGVEKRVATAFDEESADCIGCLACAKSCPTDAIAYEDKGASRTIWGKTFEVAACGGCGAPTVTAEQVAWIEKSKGVSQEDQLMCDRCKAAKTAAAYQKLAW